MRRFCMAHPGFLSVCVLSLGWVFSANAALGANAIVRLADEALVPNGAYSLEVKVTNVRSDASEELRYKVWVKGLDNCLVDTIYPERHQGRKLLMLGNDLWFYTPTIKRPTRVGFQQRLTGEVANGDIAKSNFAHDYDPALIGEESAAGKRYLKLTAKRKDSTYRSIEYWVDAETHIPEPLVQRFYAGRLLPWDYLRILGGKPPISVRHALHVWREKEK